MLVVLQRLEILDEGQHRRVVRGLLPDVRHLHIECHWRVVEHILLLEVAVLLHNLEQVTLLCDQVVVLQMVHHLPLVKV